MMMRCCIWQNAKNKSDYRKGLRQRKRKPPPKCFICGEPITEEMQWASTAKTPDGLRHYCGRTCGMKDTLDIIFG
jgi:hypothetical protein